MAKVKVEKKPGTTLEQLQANGTLPLQIGGNIVGSLVPRAFSSGSYGYGLNGVVHLKLADGTVAELQASVSFTVKHSKPKAEVELEDEKVDEKSAA